MRKQSIAFWMVAMTLVISLSLSSCTMYSEGPAFSLTPAAEKIATTWQIKDAEQGGTDITAQYASDWYEFKSDGEFKTLDALRQISLPPFTQDTSIAMVGEGEWRFLDKNQLEILYKYTYTDSYNPDVVYEEEHYELWEIARLSQEELWLRDGDLFLKMEFFVN